MTLIENPKEKIINDVSIHQGSGNLLIDVGNEQDNRSVRVFYYAPSALNDESNVLIVLPGAGRDAWGYRDAWKTAAEKHSVLILSLYYDESTYPEFWNYNLARMIANVEVDEKKSQIKDFTLTVDPERWLFGDFDRVFKFVVNALNMNTVSYDLFGHSAGGQILQRYALFHTTNKANKIISANSGWYTVPSFENVFPYGLYNSPLEDIDLESAFRQNLVLLVGEKDDANETRGHLVRNDKVDLQGTHRLERANYFYKTAKREAKQQKLDFHWQLRIIENTGHDHAKMTKAAEQYLYH
ncbi:hypothetical protein [Aestuariibacter salexigens]|uniref:hypothetical protein n=1 Tax=Aestuariibacter salexigens TaxID=226010 RepID=UPI0006889CAC|nr:hypothetical protein [Aestuariibacter salexigens]